jgi:hypothetical protein
LVSHGEARARQPTRKLRRQRLSGVAATTGAHDVSGVADRPGTCSRPSRPNGAQGGFMNMSLVRRTLLVVPAMAVFVGCAPPESNQPSDSDQEARPRMHWVQSTKNAAAAADTTDLVGPIDTAAAKVKVKYHKGPVLSNVRVVPIFWGAQTRFQADLTRFYATITNSVYIDWMREYDTPTQKIGRGRGLAGVVDSDARLGTISGADIEKELARLIDTHRVPAPDANTLYAIHFAPGVTIADGSDVSCQVYCAYHSVFKHGVNVFYSVVPDQGGDCANGCGVDGNEEHATTDSASHELAEAITDPDTARGWFADSGDEIGDLCTTGSATIDGFVVQLEWSNKHNQCIAQ